VARRPIPATPGGPPPPDDRAWSSRRSISEREARSDLARYTALPAETGPTWAPDQLSVWPVEGGRFGVDAHYHGATGAQRAAHQQRRLAAAGLHTTLHDGSSGGSALRLGPLTHDAVWIALEAFLGRPLDVPDA
jgi:hypothetical protein